MQSDQQVFLKTSMLPLIDQAGGFQNYNAPPASIFGTPVLPPGFRPSKPFQDVEFQSSEACPRNFIIFDQTDSRSQIMFHPAIAPRLWYPDLKIGPPYFYGNMEKEVANNEEKEISCSVKENSEDINVLLSLEEEEQENSDDEVSTARTDPNYGCNSPDSCSNYECESKNSSLPSATQSFGDGNNRTKRKRQKMRKTIRALRGIVPGANRMNTVAVLDEAVRYLKSLKVEVQTLGIENLRSYVETPLRNE